MGELFLAEYRPAEHRVVRLPFRNGQLAPILAQQTLTIHSHHSPQSS
ncbi:hypothetical protein Thiowin_04440 [Thiorhodovibrio winogradskyi]|uniref:Uncharacterized protein n=1 Tax=Thiorhodovibrio winogradskyi TaxID=77007 RepID=A0ABZ0SF88_9GAMM